MRIHKSRCVALAAFMLLNVFPATDVAYGKKKDKGGGGSTEADAGLVGGYTIMGVGTVGGHSRTLSLEGLKQKTWADYALWSDDNRDMYFKSGEKFYGKIHSNTKLYFSGDPEFYEEVTSADSGYGGSISSCIFHKGFERSVSSETMASVDFSKLKKSAIVGLEGATTVILSHTNMFITNSREGWSSHSVPCAGEVLVYVANASSGGSAYGDITVRGILDGRVTLVSERDVLITDNVEYEVNPIDDGSSDDALGIIANRDIVVKYSFPDNGKIFAHMMATGRATATSMDGSFGVEYYNYGSPRGTLNVHGGIVQAYRGAVGKFNKYTGAMLSGFAKNYTYDTRFRTSPPPHYPPLSDTFDFDTWRER